MILVSTTICKSLRHPVRFLEFCRILIPQSCICYTYRDWISATEQGHFEIAESKYSIDFTVSYHILIDILSFCCKMGKKHNLSPTKRVQIVNLVNDAKWSRKRVARHFKIVPSRVQHAIKSYNETGSFRDASRAADRRYRLSVINRNSSVWSKATKENRYHRCGTSLEQMMGHCSTISRCLTKGGLNARVAAKKPFVSEANKKKILEFVEKYRSQ